MKKFGITAVILLSVILIMGCCLVGCDKLNINGDKNVDVTAVQLKDTEIYMSPYGEPSVFVLEPWVMPTNATNPRVTYKLLDNTDREYLTIDQTTGTIKASLAKETPVVIRVSSESNPSVYVDVKVTIETVAVKRIYFETESLEITLGGDPVQVEPQFSPYHAILGRNVSYSSLNTDVATVDSKGIVTPVGVGETTIWVVESNDENVTESELVKGNLHISVRYSEPNYKLSIDDVSGSCKQIIGATTPIVLALDKMDTTCDPHPLIRWRVANANIPQTEDYKTISYNPEDLPRGEYQVEATITDHSRQEQKLYSETIYVYEPLSGINVNIYNTKEELEKLSVNEKVKMEVSFSADEYPPDNYRWEIYKDGELFEVLTYASKVFEYKIKSSGTYSFACEAIIKGVPSGIRRTTDEIKGSGELNGCQIDSLYVTGKKFNDDILAYVTWDGIITGGVSYMVQIETEEGKDYTLSSNDSDYKPYFTRNGVYIPDSIAGLDDSFTVSVRTSNYGWCDEVKYKAGTIKVTSANKSYFETLIGEFDKYIDNMEEMGALLNYISLFRPESLKQADGFYKIDVMVPFTYASLDLEVYVLPDPVPTVSDENKDIFNIIFASFNCYCESVSYTPSVLFDASTRVLTLKVKFSDTDSFFTATSPEVNPYTNAVSDNHYTKQPDSTRRLPIYNNDNTMEVSTSAQIYYAIEHGFRPVAVSGSQAESILNTAETVARKIIDDDMSDAEKVHAIYDYLTLETIYDKWLSIQDLSGQPNVVYESFSLEGVFNKNLAVCDGISKSFVVLCGLEGIPAVKVNGYAGGTAHAWNKVLVDGKWYTVDATWGSILTGNVEIQTHRYLLITDSMVSSNHKEYGIYPTTADTQNPIYYTTLLTEGVDAVIDSEDDLKAFINYFADEIAVGETMWKDCMLSQEYYEEIKTSLGQSINGVLYEALSEKIGGYSFAVDVSGSKFVNIKITKNS